MNAQQEPHSASSRWEAFRARVEELRGTVLEPAWLGTSKPHHVRCERGHDCFPRPKSVLRGQGICRTCAGRNPEAAAAAFLTALAAGGATLLEDGWLGCNTPHRVRCAEGHLCSPRPTSLQQGSGICRACAGRDPVNAEAVFRAKLVELDAILLEPKWLGSDKPHRVRCARGHLVTPHPNSLLQGKGLCRICSSRATVVYVVVDDSADLLKFGITTGDPRVRLRRHRQDGFERAVRIYTGLPEGAALEVERALLRGLRDAGETPVRGREYFEGRVQPLVVRLIDDLIGQIHRDNRVNLSGLVNE